MQFIRNNFISKYFVVSFVISLFWHTTLFSPTAKAGFIKNLCNFALQTDSAQSSSSFVRWSIRGLTLGAATLVLLLARDITITVQGTSVAKTVTDKEINEAKAYAKFSDQYQAVMDNIDFIKDGYLIEANLSSHKVEYIYGGYNLLAISQYSGHVVALDKHHNVYILNPDNHKWFLIGSNSKKIFTLDGRLCSLNFNGDIEALLPNTPVIWHEDAVSTGKNTVFIWKPHYDNESGPILELQNTGIQGVSEVIIEPRVEFGDTQVRAVFKNGDSINLKQLIK